VHGKLCHILMTKFCRASEDMKKVEQILLEAQNLQKLVHSFVNTRMSLFGNYIVPFQKLVLSSPNLCRALARQDFMGKLMSRLNTENITLRLNLLKILLAILRSHSKPRAVAMTYDVEKAVQPLTAVGIAVLVKEMATTILQEISQASSPLKETNSGTLKSSEITA
jgi:hypothetical protein